MLLLIARRRGWCGLHSTVFILGAFIGLGFQIIEDIVVYAMSSAGPQFVATIVLRMFTPAAHFLWSAIFCAGLGPSARRPAQPRSGSAGCLLPTAHYCSARDLELAEFCRRKHASVRGPAHRDDRRHAHHRRAGRRVDRRTQREFMREVMSPEMARDVIGAAEFDAMAGNRKALKAYARPATTAAQRVARPWPCLTYRRRSR